jgi:LysM repeat protein
VAATAGAPAADAGGASAGSEPDSGILFADASASDDPSNEDRSAADERLYRPRPAHRKWAEPPPWAGSATSAAAAGGAASGGPSAPEARGEVSPEATGLASSRWLDDGGGGPDRARSARDIDTPGFLAGRAIGADDDSASGQELASVAPKARRPVPRTTAGRSAAAGERSTTRRPVIGQARPVAHVEHDDGAPSWERPRRFEAYPTLKRRVGMPAMSRLTIGVIALVVAALLLLMLPALFLGGANQETKATPSPSAVPSASVTLAVPAAPTPLTYTVRAGDTLARIATKYGVTQKRIMAVNPTIKDPDKIVIGQVIVIPTAGPSDVIDSGPTASPPPSS